MFGKVIKVCCGPRCGAFPQHRAIYAAVEARTTLPVVPVMCRGLCQGVTVILPDKQKVVYYSVTDTQTLCDSALSDSL